MLFRNPEDANDIREVSAIDAAGWRAAGWEEVPEDVISISVGSSPVQTDPAHCEMWDGIDPSTLTTIHAIDRQGWIDAGWIDWQPLASNGNPPIDHTETPEEAPDRLAQLQAMSWQELQAVAATLNLTKPEGLPWREFIPDILAAEQS